MKNILTLFILFCTLLGSAQKKRTVSNWPKAVSYEIFIQSFCDSDGDGIGDLIGATSKLDYLKDLGIGSVWLMPIMPSPSYHKYNVTDYYDIHPDYGTINDFKIFVNEAHKRNIKVIIDLVLNHCSRQHPWFLEASKDITSPYWDYFVWTHKDDPQVKAFVTHTEEDTNNRNRWNIVDGSDYLYYSYFGPHMPDLNFDSPKLRAEVFKIGRYWLEDIGVDGFRLDAAKHIYPNNRAKDSHAWWIYFLNEMKKVKKDVHLVGEVWASSDIVAPYLEGIPALFDFDMASVIKKAVRNEIGDSLAFHHQKIISYYTSTNPEFIDATFLSNHDQTRVITALGNDENKAKIAASILMTLPGSPYIYYGEELGMQGDEPDEFIREPFLWDVEKKDKCRTRWETPIYNSDSTIAPLSLQSKDIGSFYQNYKSLIALRNSSSALTFGKMKPVGTGIQQICAFTRSTEDENLLVVHNLSGKEVKYELTNNLKVYSDVMYKSTESNSFKNNILKVASYGTIILSDK